MAAPIGNEYGRKYTEEDALVLFDRALMYANYDDNCLCVQDAIFESGIAYTTFYSLCDQFQALNDIKKNINAAVIRRINKGALKGDYNCTAGIWRMKQLGEKDEKYQDITSGGDKVEPTTIGFKRNNDRTE